MRLRYLTVNHKIFHSDNKLRFRIEPKNPILGEWPKRGESKDEILHRMFYLKISSMICPLLMRNPVYPEIVLFYNS